MRRDRALLERVDSAASQQTWVRFYRWTGPTVSLGRHQQPVDAIDSEYCRLKSIPWVSRPTGGAAVLHADELTYAVASNDFSRFPAGVIATYLVIARALRAGLASIGVQTEIAPAAPAASDASTGLPCFASISSHELTLGGRKVAGSAQRRTKRAFLQHGSIPLTLDYPTMEHVFRLPAHVLRSRFTALEEAGERPDFESVARALASAFENVLHLRLTNP